MVIAAPNGARRMQADHPALPVTANELADCAATLPDLGVSVLHLHVRDREGQHTLDPDAYRAAMRRIGARTGDALIVQVTTEAIGRYSADEQMAVVRELRPEAVSLALRELCPDPAAETAAAAFFAWLVAERIWPQYILHSAADLERFEALRRRGLFADDQPSCLLVLGRYGEQQHGEPAELDTLLPSLDPGLSWSVCCFGPREHDVWIACEIKRETCIWERPTRCAISRCTRSSSKRIRSTLRSRSGRCPSRLARSIAASARA